MAFFPTIVPPIVLPDATTAMNAVGFEHHTQHDNDSSNIAGLATKLGTGSSAPSGTLVLAASGSGTSAWTGALSVTSVATGSLAVSGNGTVGGTLGVTGVVTASTGITVTAGGLTVTAGGILVSAGGIAVTGASSITATASATITLAIKASANTAGESSILQFQANNGTATSSFFNDATGAFLRIKSLGSMTLHTNSAAISATGLAVTIDTSQNVTLAATLVVASSTTIAGGTIGYITLNAAVGIMLQGTTGTTGVAQYGVQSDLTFGTTATTSGTAFFARVNAVNSSFTMTNAYGLYVAAHTKGASATITNSYGLYLEAQTVGGTINLSLYNLGTSRFDQMIRMGATPSATLSIGLDLNTALTLVGDGGANAQGIAVRPTFAATTTAEASCIYIKANTTASVYTTTSLTGLYVDAFGRGASSIITTLRGIWVKAQTATSTTAIGIQIDAPSGGGTNIGLQNNGTTQLTSLGAFAASDKYVIVDSSGNLHKSALGPAS